MSYYREEVGCKDITTIPPMENERLYCNECIRYVFSHLGCPAPWAFFLQKMPFRDKALCWLLTATINSWQNSENWSFGNEVFEAGTGLSELGSYNRVSQVTSGACAGGGLRKYFIFLIAGDQNKTGCRIQLPSLIYFFCLFGVCSGICNADDHPEQNFNSSLQKLQLALLRQHVGSCESVTLSLH